MTPFSWNNPYAWPRRPVLAENAVATSQPLAAQAGLQMLAAGGTAVDAALAAAITLTLVEAVSNGIARTPTPSSGTAGSCMASMPPVAPRPAGRRSSSLARRRCRCAAGTRLRFRAAYLPGSSCIANSAGCHLKSCLKEQFNMARRISRLADHRRAVEKQVPELKAQPDSPQPSCPAGARRGRASVSAFPSTPVCSSRLQSPEERPSTGKSRGKNRSACQEARSGDARLRPRGAPPDWIAPLQIDYRGYTLHELPPNGQGSSR